MHKAGFLVYDSRSLKAGIGHSGNARTCSVLVVSRRPARNFPSKIVLQSVTCQATFHAWLLAILTRAEGNTQD